MEVTLSTPQKDIEATALIPRCFSPLSLSLSRFLSLYRQIAGKKRRGKGGGAQAEDSRRETLIVRRRGKEGYPNYPFSSPSTFLLCSMSFLAHHADRQTDRHLGHLNRLDLLDWNSRPQPTRVLRVSPLFLSFLPPVDGWSNQGTRHVKHVKKGPKINSSEHRVQKKIAHFFYFFCLDYRSSRISLVENNHDKDNTFWALHFKYTMWYLSKLSMMGCSRFFCPNAPVHVRENRNPPRPSFPFRNTLFF